MIKKYQKKNGDTAYMFKTYLGIDPLTGKKCPRLDADLSHHKKQKSHWLD